MSIDSSRPSSSTAAEWITAPSGCSAGIELEQLFQPPAIGDVAGGDLDLGAELRQPAAQLCRAPRQLAGAAGQEQLAGAVGLDQVLGDQGAEAAGAAGDQDRALGVEPRGKDFPGLAGDETRD